MPHLQVGGDCVQIRSLIFMRLPLGRTASRLILQPVQLLMVLQALKRGIVEDFLGADYVGDRAVSDQLKLTCFDRVVLKGRPRTPFNAAGCNPA